MKNRGKNTTILPNVKFYSYCEEFQWRLCNKNDNDKLFAEPFVLLITNFQKDFLSTSVFRKNSLGKK